MSHGLKLIFIIIYAFGAGTEYAEKMRKKSKKTPSVRFIRVIKVKS
jgi:hypothetical protein